MYTNQSLGDKLFDIAIYTLVIVWLAGWVLLLFVMLVQKLFPKIESRMEEFLQVVGKPLGLLQKYTLIAVALLILIKLLAGWLGW